MLNKGAIGKAEHCPGKFMSNIFTRDRKNENIRIILSLKELRKHIKYMHFKMNSSKKIAELVKPDCYMASIDFKDAYFTLPIAPKDRKYLRFFWQGKLYQFCCLLFGLSPAPRIFIKIMKPPMTVLRQIGHKLTDYIDDIWLVGKTKMEDEQNITDPRAILTNLGFIINDR